MIELQQPPSTLLPAQRYHQGEEQQHVGALPDEALAPLRPEAKEQVAAAMDDLVGPERDTSLPFRAADGPTERAFSSLSLRSYSMSSTLAGMVVGTTAAEDTDCDITRRVSTPSTGQSSSITLSTEALSHHDHEAAIFQEPFSSSPVTWSQPQTAPLLQQQQQETHSQGQSQTNQHQHQFPHHHQQHHLPLQPIQPQSINQGHALYCTSSSSSASHEPYYHPYQNPWVPGEGYGNVSMSPYSPQMLSPLETEYRRSSHPSHLYSDSSLPPVPTTAAAYYSPYFQHHSQVNPHSPVRATPATKKEESCNPEQALSAPINLAMPRRKTSYHPYYVPSQHHHFSYQPQQQQQQVPYQATHHHQQQHQQQQLHHRQQLPRRSSVLGIKMEHARSSPMIKPSSIMAPSGSVMSDLRHSTLNGAGPHYGRLPDGNIIELYPAMMRTTQACEYCRSRKAKCSGDMPCERCEKKGVPCQYAQLDKKRKVKTLLSSE